MNAWKNQFERPTHEALIAGLDEEQQASYRDIMIQMKQHMPTKPTTEWLGARWRWCDVWSNENQSWLDTLAIIPDPDGIKIAVKFSTAFFASHPPSSLPKSLHTGMSSAVSIGHQTWCEWAMTSQEVISSICILIDLGLSND